MEHEKRWAGPSLDAVILAKRMLTGALINFILVAVFLYGVNNPDPAWGKFWMVRPLIILPMAGASAGAFYYFMESRRFKKGFQRLLAIVVSILVFIVALWLGTVVGFNGTLWN